MECNWKKVMMIYCICNNCGKEATILGEGVVAEEVIQQYCNNGGRCLCDSQDYTIKEYCFYPLESHCQKTDCS